MGRTATALAARTSVPWDADLKKRAEDAMLRMEGEGHRVMAAAFRDLDPATFDAKGDLLGPRHRSRTDLAGRHGRPAPGRVQGSRAECARSPTVRARRGSSISPCKQPNRRTKDATVTEYGTKELSVVAHPNVTGCVGLSHEPFGSPVVQRPGIFGRGGPASSMVSGISPGSPSAPAPRPRCSRVRR